MAVSVRITGAEELIAKLNRMGVEVPTTLATDAAKAGGETFVSFARDNVWANFTQRSGALSDSLKVVVTRAGYVRAGSYGLVYNKIHEYGGVITPKRARTLSWIDDDGVMRFAKMVYIPARPYIRPAFDEHKSDIIESMSTVIKAYMDSV